MDKLITPENLRNMVEEYVLSYSEKYNEPNIWRKPLLATAKSDERFKKLTKIAANNHLMPWELMPSAKSVIVFFIPFIKDLVVENHSGKFPCRNWAFAYESTNRLINSLCEQIKNYLKSQGYNSELTPATHNFDTKKLVARWSHKHLGYLAGLGRFGVNAQFITPSGCAGRLGSLVTDAQLGDSSLVEDKELCLHKLGHQCLICVKRCPVGAVSEHGIDRERCWKRLKINLAREEFADFENTTHVCGKCQVYVPCSLGIPQSQT